METEHQSKARAGAQRLKLQTPECTTERQPRQEPTLEVKARDSIVDALASREISASTVLQLGLPWCDVFHVDGKKVSHSIEYDCSVVVAYLAELAEVDRSSLCDLPAAEVLKLCPVVAKLVEPDLFTPEYSHAAVSRFKAIRRLYQ